MTHNTLPSLHTSNPTYKTNINSNNNKLLQKREWQRYANSQLFLGVTGTADTTASLRFKRDIYE
jgi:hypothetical protein